MSKEGEVHLSFTVVSTFSGCGGSCLGYKMAGGKLLLAVEWDDNAVETYRANFPDVPIFHGDIAKLSVERVFELTGLKEGELDLFDGSPPCQGFSTAGKREFNDSRNQLFKEYVRLLSGLRPKTFVMENVSGMVKGQMKLMFAEILRELKSAGYKVSAKLLNAMHYGVPQSRERMIFVGVREDLGIVPSHPVGSARVALPKKLDTHPAKYSEKRYGDELCSEKKTSRNDYQDWAKVLEHYGGVWNQIVFIRWFVS
ncbi:MAG: DNA cytosine methyltransferase [Hyphomicrobiaceae bacterium]|nr:MAG: DNA cytosine methyltransferase [Hyphomicrobiaceae bacterium]